MRILLVTYRYGEEITGGGERYLRELMVRLADRGHEVEVFTTCSRHMVISPFSYLVWDNFLEPGREEDRGVGINRFKAKNPRPRKAQKLVGKLNDLQKKERSYPELITLMAGALRGQREHCYLSGWHELEIWEDGPARWTRGRADLAVGGIGIKGLRIEAYSYLDGHLHVEVPGKGSWEFELEKGRPRELYLDFSPCDGIPVRLHVPQTVRPTEDDRVVGVAVRKVVIEDDEGEHELDLARDWNAFLENGPEKAVGEVLWAAAGTRPRRTSRWHRYLMGPRSPRLERGVMSAARDFDIVLGSMVPMTTMHLAWKAAKKAGKPLVAFPLFHTRDPNHYWMHFKNVLDGADGVEANSPVIAELMTGWGFDAFAVGPGFDLDEFSSPHIDGRRFRDEFGFGDRPLLLWVARKNVYKGYHEAISTLQAVQQEERQVALALIGPDEDHLPVSGEGVYYLGAQPREKVLNAFDACDVFIFPSLHESFCLVFCEAWLRGKPVLGNVYCAAARGLIENGENGYLCADAREYGNRVLELINDPEKARRMGERGREKVLRTRGWDHLVKKMEEKLESIVENRNQA
ncbi:MAG: glycosyltransferase [Actinomycetota bacterium]|nr:glycosyltransferase [Actinomycetota bacterium]